jgi:hypothetical protein
MTNLSVIQIRALAESDIPGALELWFNVDGLGLTESYTSGRISLILEGNPGICAIALAPDKAG